MIVLPFIVLLCPSGFGDTEGAALPLTQAGPSTVRLRAALSRIAGKAAQALKSQQQLQAQLQEERKRPDDDRGALKKATDKPGITKRERGKQVPQFPFDPFDTNSTAATPNIVVWATPTEGNTKMAFGMVTDTRLKKKWPSTSIECHESVHFCVTCADVAHNCKAVLAAMSFECEFAGGVKTAAAKPNLQCEKYDLHFWDTNNRYVRIKSGQYKGRRARITAKTSSSSYKLLVRKTFPDSEEEAKEYEGFEGEFVALVELTEEEVESDCNDEFIRLTSDTGFNVEGGKLIVLCPIPPEQVQ